ncbi:MAG: energy transducer TonB [Xanthomonadaceae bacterium]|nr:energy transducer TonB [Xanthomonadaceae bacterium]
MLFSLIAHAVVILGVTFTYTTPASRLPALDVILIQATNKEKADKADFLAQSNNAGGGDRDEARRPADPLSSPVPKPTPGVAPRPLEAGAPQPTPATPTEVLTQKRADFAVTTAREAPESPSRPRPTAQELVEHSAEMAQLAQEYQRQRESYAKRPKKKFLSANTKEYAYASYLAGWAARIERIGNLNYPDEARRQQLHGDVLLTVTLNKDGSVKRMDVIQGSGHKLLDDAVQRIVQLAAPFPPIPKTGEDIDELYITRTWQFLPGDVLRNR